MKRWQGRVAVVTGASAGIGAAICQDLVEQGMVVVGLARREDKLKELRTQLQGQPGTLHFVRTDISQDDEVKAAFKWIKENLGGVDVLINNAGTNVRGSISDVNVDEWRRVYSVNVFAVGTCVQEAVRSMQERNVDGHIVIINSIASHRGPKPNMTVYSSSKHASKIITEGLKKELVAQKSKIKVTSISPGLVNTELFAANDIKMNFTDYAHLQPKDIAEGIRYVISTPPHVQVLEMIIRAVDDDI